MSFHVPERYRIRSGPLGSGPDYGNNGAFLIPPSLAGKRPALRVIATDNDGWEHVSVSTPSRCPTWDEMCLVKLLFWDAEDCVMQLHPPESRWINNHPHCLHLWRPQAVEIPQPPAWMVGDPKSNLTREARR
jgi:hypothetical protein